MSTAALSVATGTAQARRSRSGPASADAAPATTASAGRSSPPSSSSSRCSSSGRWSTASTSASPARASPARRPAHRLRQLRRGPPGPDHVALAAEHAVVHRAVDHPAGHRRAWSSRCSSHQVCPASGCGGCRSSCRSCCRPPSSAQFWIWMYQPALRPRELPAGGRGRRPGRLAAPTRTWAMLAIVVDHRLVDRRLQLPALPGRPAEHPGSSCTRRPRSTARGRGGSCGSITLPHAGPDHRAHRRCCRSWRR